MPGSTSRVRITTAANTTTTLNEEAHKRLEGWYIGGGVEWKISPGWTAGLEYRHYEFDPENTTRSTRLPGLRSNPLGSMRPPTAYDPRELALGSRTRGRAAQVGTAPQQTNRGPQRKLWPSFFLVTAVRQVYE